MPRSPLLRDEDLESWNSRIRFQSYGELGMILGMLARVVKLTWTVAGLKVLRCHCFDIRLLTRPSAFSLRHLHPRLPPYIRLTTSHLQIFEFFGLAYDVHERGFITAQEVFDWVTASRCFNPHRLSITPHHEEPQVQRRKEEASGILGLPRVAHRLRRAK